MSMQELNRKHNSKNPHQGPYSKVLCVCSAGLLRSPTAALVLSQEPFNFNTRAAGLTPDFALVRVDDVLLHWADLVVCMELEQFETLQGKHPAIVCLEIEDSFAYRDENLIALIKSKFIEKTGFEKV